MLNDGHIFLKILWIQSFNILLSKKDGALIWVIETFQKLNDGRFTTSASSNERNGLVLCNLYLGLLDDLNILFGGVSESDIIQGDGSVIKGFLSDFIATLNFYLWFIEEDFCNGSCGSEHAHNFTKN